MSNIVDFLEQVGQSACLRHASRAELAEAMTAAQIDPFLQQAILGDPQCDLGVLIGAPANVCNMIALPDEDEKGAGEIGSGTRTTA
jgi:hypothetical protein